MKKKMYGIIKTLYLRTQTMKLDWILQQLKYCIKNKKNGGVNLKDIQNKENKLNLGISENKGIGLKLMKKTFEKIYMEQNINDSLKKKSL